MNKLSYFFVVSYACVLIISSLLITLTMYINIPFLYNISSIYTTSKILFIAMLIIGIIGIFTLGKKIPNFLFSISMAICLAPTLFILISYSIDTLIETNYLINHIIAYLFSTMLSFYIGYIFIISKLNFTLQNLYGALVILFLTINFILIPSNSTNHIHIPIYNLNKKN